MMDLEKLAIETCVRLGESPDEYDHSIILSALQRAVAEAREEQRKSDCEMARKAVREAEGLTLAEVLDACAAIRKAFAEPL